ncbi:DUF3025 domain-containing protein [Zobellella iuensis]|uniref:DUF3025 domain-containing protein n=1 Tax=Zobellella iuensis TaxID=2803811 RepID=A0ABS1QQP0_9GAMM|nr:DUF3025 domain-containing protein [Zobellella iuensis]MBL1377186.1 DUF3025 domain-containing protein [Zobellella iuensis]
MDWDPAFTERNAILATLGGLVPIEDVRWPPLSELNRLLAVHLPVRFIDNDHFAELGCGYEEAVSLGMVPTRADNWHDFFGALIWYLFPRTKALLNRLHMQDIEDCGSRRRTPRRDRLTHFDECGLVLAVPECHELEPLLLEHDWQQLFLANRPRWGRDWQPFVFGHALYEQALSPFIGFTGKAVLVEMEPGFFRLPTHQRYPLLDARLSTHLEHSALFDRPRPLLPVPLLGIPGWWPANEDPAFYLNRDYFRPKRNR